jgi:hypothetical protein
MKNIKFMKIEGFLEVNGVFNYNGVGKLNGFKNHKFAKKDRSDIDFTSSRCLRHEIFKDLQPQQPASKEFVDHFLNLVASEVGLLRGFLDPDTGFKRSSPLHIADAYTDSKESVIFFDQGSSSKPKESEKVSKKGENIGDNSVFSQDNAPKRKQTISAAINIKELQFLHLDEVDPSFRLIDKNSEKKFLEKLKEYFDFHKVDSNLEIKKYVDKASVLKVPRAGILLNNQQISHLVKMVVARIASLNSIKTGASIKTDQTSLKITVSDGFEENCYSFSSDYKDQHHKFEYNLFYEAL